MKRHFNEYIRLSGDYVFVDSETSGLDPIRYEVWSVQVGDKERGTIITAPRYNETALRYLRDMIKGKTVVAHNVKFDLQVLWVLGIYPERVYCTRLVEDCLRMGSNYDPSLAGCLKKYGIATLSKDARKDFYCDTNGKPSQDSGLPTIFELSGYEWTEGLQEYAFQDIAHLPELKERQQELVVQQGKETLVRVENSYSIVASGLEYFGVLWDAQAAEVFQRDMAQERDKWQQIVVPELESHYLKVARENYQRDYKIFAAWEVVWEEKKSETNKMRDGNKLNAEAQRIRDEWKKKRPFQSKPKAPEGFNLNSTKQLLMALNEAGVEVESTKHDTLVELSVEHPILEKLLKYRKYEKLTQMISIEDKVSKDGRIRPKVTQILSTGRQATSSPNVQQIPSHSEEGKRFRSLFVPSPGCTLFGADYSAIELVIAGVNAGDEALLHAIKNEPDLHCFTIGRMLDVPSSEVVAVRKGEGDERAVLELQEARKRWEQTFRLPELNAKESINDWVNLLRDYTKTLTYGLIYGLSVFGLMSKFHCDKESAEGFMDSFFRVYPDIKSYIDSQSNYAAEVFRTVPTAIGRDRFFIKPSVPFFQSCLNKVVGAVDEQERKMLAEDLFKEEKKLYNQKMNRIKRQAGNFPMQAACADMVKLASVYFAQEFPLPLSETRLILSVHDELIGETPIETFDEAAAHLKYSMEKAAEKIIGAGWVEVTVNKMDHWRK